MSLTAATTDERVRSTASELGARGPRIARSLGSYSGAEGGDAVSHSLDPLPHVVDAERWRPLAAAVEQRTRLLRAVVDDLYGPRRLLASGLLPAEPILADPSYLRSMRGDPRAAALAIHAVDVCHVDGEPVVLADRVDVVGGVGRVLEHRRVMAAVHDDLHLAANPASLIGWFASLRTAVGRAAPEGSDEPRIVILTPGSGWRGSGEHLYLARNLGLTVAEPADLTVRGGSVWLKAVSGLEPVDVVVRFVEAVAVDPLESRGDAASGVAGLLEAVRRGTVAVVNPPTAAVAENLVVSARSEALCGALLGEQLLAANVPSWWCGDDLGRSHVLANLERMVVRPVCGGGTPWIGRRLSADGRIELADRLRRCGQRYVANEEVEPDAVTGWDGHLVAHPAAMRLFGATDPEGVTVMPGALTRRGADLPALLDAGVAGPEAWHDTWVIGAPIVATSSAGSGLAQIDLSASLPSRAAEAMFWVGRNLERADAVLRVVRAVEQRRQQWPDIRWEANSAWWTASHDAVAAVSGIDAGSVGDELLSRAIGDPSARRSVVTSLRHLVRGARSVTELFSADTWHVLGELTAASTSLSLASSEIDLRDAAARARTPLAAVAGLASESMVRDPSWCFIDLGRRIERIISTIDIVRGLLGVEPVAPVAPVVFETVLAACDSLVAYRRRYRSDPEPLAVAQLVLSDVTNPRSVAFQLERIDDVLSLLPNHEAVVRRRGLGHLGAPWTIAADLTALRDDAVGLSAAISLQYFLHSRPRAVRP